MAFVAFGEGAARVTRALGDAALRVGRDPSNDVVVDDSSVSRFHAALWVDGSTVRVRDLGSTNGTFVDEQKVDGVAAAGTRARVRIGDRFVIEVVGLSAPAAPPRLSLWLSGTQISFPLVSDRLYLGPDREQADVVIDGAASTAVVMVDEDGRCWLGTDDDERPIEVGVPFPACGRSFELRASPAVGEATVESSARQLCRLDVESGPKGVEAVLHDPKTGAKLDLGAGQRSILLWWLGAQHLIDRKAATAPPGWCTDADVKRALWGKQGDDNNLNVLLYRIRADLRRAGLDPFVIERRDGRLRARLGTVRLGVGVPERG